MYFDTTHIQTIYNPFQTPISNDLRQTEHTVHSGWSHHGDDKLAWVSRRRTGGFLGLK